MYFSSLCNFSHFNFAPLRLCVRNSSLFYLARGKKEVITCPTTRPNGLAGRTSFASPTIILAGAGAEPLRRREENKD